MTQEEQDEKAAREFMAKVTRTDCYSRRHMERAYITGTTHERAANVTKIATYEARIEALEVELVNLFGEFHDIDGELYDPEAFPLAHELVAKKPEDDRLAGGG